jgi:hypothetical protein
MAGRPKEISEYAAWDAIARIRMVRCLPMPAA